MDLSIWLIYHMFGDKQEESFSEQSISHKDYFFLPFPLKYFLPHVTVLLWLTIRIKKPGAIEPEHPLQSGRGRTPGEKSVLTLLNTEDED